MPDTKIEKNEDGGVLRSFVWVLILGAAALAVATTLSR